MVPRFRPYLGAAELVAAARARAGLVERFEAAFAVAFASRHGIAFSYGRTALWAFLRALGIEQAEVVLPAYTCAVVAHAVVLSGNVPRFVDVTLDDYNVDLDQLEAAITARTRVVVATHLWGYPLDVDRLAAIVRAAEARHGEKIWIVQDCAHSFDARWRGRSVCAEPDVALFGLNVSKTMTSIFGGMLTTNDGAVAERVRRWRDAHCTAPGRGKALRRFAYLVAVQAAFSPALYGLVNVLERRTAVLDAMTKAYHVDGKIWFPPDHLERMCDVEAAVGMAQLGRYPAIVERRRRHAAAYDRALADVPGIVRPPLVEGATYSHYVARVEHRARVVESLRRAGIDLGQLADYVVPDLPGYEPYAAGDFPNARLASRTVINLPVHAQLTDAERERVVGHLRAAVRAGAPRSAPLGVAAGTAPSR